MNSTAGTVPAWEITLSQWLTNKVVGAVFRGSRYSVFASAEFQLVDVAEKGTGSSVSLGHS